MAARKKKTSFDWNKFISDRISGLGSGLLALLIIVGGFFILSDISQTNQTNSKQNQSKSDEQKAKAEQNKKPEIKPSAVKANPPTSHIVASGESLWTIAGDIYQDNYKWTLLASENKIENPDYISEGMKLTIPQVLSNQDLNQAQPSSQIRSYTVVNGDSLWSIAETFYGTGFKWTEIKNANQDKIGLLPDGEPLITPNTVLSIPAS